MMLAVVGSGVYKTFLYLHILSAIVGFGAVVLNGVYAAQVRKRPGREGQAIFEANSFIALHIAEYVIYGVFVFGFITALIGKPAVKFSQAWLSTSMVLYLVGIDHKKLTYKFQGRDFRLTDVSGNVVQKILA